jgi:hypothetical protein
MAAPNLTLPSSDPPQTAARRIIDPSRTAALRGRLHITLRDGGGIRRQPSRAGRRRRTGRTLGPMADSDVEAVLHRWWDEVWGRGDLDVIDEVLANPYVRHDHSGTRLFTPARYKQEMVQYLRVIQRAQTTVDDMAIVEDKAWARLTSRGVSVDVGEMVTITWLQVHRVQEGRLAESWILYRPNLDWTS